jgi:uncharacterized membrane protein
MFWFFAAFIATLARTGTHVVNKRILQKARSVTLVTATTFFICLVYLPVFIYSVVKEPVITSYPLAFFGVAASALLNAVAIVMLMQGLKFGDMSIAVPLRNLVPLFALIWAVAFLHETVTPMVITATFLIVCGAMLLHIEKGFKLVLKKKASLFALSAALLYSFALIADKFVLNHIKPINYTFLVYLTTLVFLLLFNVIIKNLKNVQAILRNNWKPIVLVAVLANLGSFFTFTAISLTDVTKIAPVLRMEVLFSVVAGGLFFKEKNILFKILGSGLLIAGVLMIIL